MRRGEREGQAKRQGGREADRTRSSVVRSQRERWEVIRVNYSRSITRAIKVRAKRLLITKEANSLRLAHAPFAVGLATPCALFLFLFSTDSSVSAGTTIYSVRSKFHPEFCFLNVCALRLYLSLPLAVSRAPFLPRIVAPRDGRPRGEAGAGGRLDISSVLSVISLVLLLPPNSLHPPPPAPALFPSRSPIYSQRASPRSPPGGQRVRRVA